MFSRDIATYHKQAVKRTLAEAFPDVRANAITHFHRPSFLRQAATAIRAAWRDTLEGLRP